MRRFSVRPEIYYSDRALESLFRPWIKRVMIVIDPVMKENGAGALVERVFAGRGVSFSYYEEVKPDPGLDLITEGVRLALEFSPQLIAAVGGGSAIDEAKAIVFLYAKISRARGEVSPRPLFAAIPTTSGTGSEVTNVSVVTVEGTKTVLTDDGFFPDVAVVDAEFVRTLPLPLLAETASDALTHALEALISRDGSDCSDALAEKAVKLIFRHLKEVFACGGGFEDRSRIHNASCMAGMAFTNASLGINHSMAHAFGSVFHVSHGRANALFLTKTLKFNAREPRAAEKLAGLSRELGFARSGACGREACVERLLARIRRLFNICGLPASVSALGISREDYVREIPEMTRRALADKCTAANPSEAGAEDFIRLFLLACD